MDTSKFVIMLTSLVVMALLVGAVLVPVVSSSTTRTITVIDENEEPGWLKFGYSTTENYNFNVEIDGDNLNVGGLTGELYDMMVLSTDALSIVVDEDTLVAITPNGAVDLGTTATVVKTSGGLNVNGTTYSAPLWSYYPKATGNYAYFDHADLLTDDAPLSTWGNFAGIYTYNGIDSLNIGLTLDATITDGVIEGAVWTGSPSEDVEISDEPFNPGSLNPLDPSVIDNPFDPDEPSADIQSADPSNGTRIGNYYYYFGNGFASVVGWSSETTDWTIPIPDTVENNGVSYPVTVINTQAFNGCTNLALTSLPSGVTHIYNGAFRDCTNLALTSLPDGLTSIDANVFYGCTNLALTSLPDGITIIEDYAFNDCTNLALTSLPSGVTSIGTSAFRNCTNLALTSLPDGITRINSNVFQNCTNLALTSLPDGVTSIGSNAFAGCTNLALTSLPDGVTSISSNAFKNCYALKSIVIYGNPVINADTFTGCSLGGLVIVDSPTFANDSLRMAGISEVLNLGTSEITSTTGGLSDAEVRTNIEALGYVAPLSITHSEQIIIESPTTDIINILPLIAGISLLLIGLAMFITRRV